MSEAAMKREAELQRLRRRVRRAVRRGDADELEQLSALYAERKAEHVTASHEEQLEAARARRALQRAEDRPQRWRRPRGFGVTPMRIQRAKEPGPKPAPQIPNGGRGLRPWHVRGGPSEVIWRPGS